MTIQGAVYELEQMLSRTDIPDYIKPTIKKVIETIVDEFNDQQAESEQEPAEWIVDKDDSRRWDRVRFYCSACNGWNTYGKSKYCPNCGRRMQREGLQRENS